MPEWNEQRLNPDPLRHDLTLDCRNYFPKVALQNTVYRLPSNQYQPPPDYETYPGVTSPQTQPEVTSSVRDQDSTPEHSLADQFHRDRREYIEKVTVYDQYPPYVSQYNVYRKPEVTSQTSQPSAQNSQSRNDLSHKQEDQSSSANEDPLITIDIIRKHWCYYVICCGLLTD